MRVVITGASGYLAYFVVRELFEEHSLECWIRPGETPQPHRFVWLDKPGVTYRKVDLADPADVAQNLVGVDTIVHLAYAHEPGRYREGHGNDLAGWYRSNVEMHLNLVLAAHAQRVERFILLSSRAAYGSVASSLSEGSALWPDSHYGALKAASEMLLAAFDDMRHCAIRSTGVYGCVEPMASSKWLDLVRMLRKSRVLARDQVGTEVHGRDLARVVARVLMTEEAWPSVVNVSDLIVSHAMIADVVERLTGFEIDVRQRLAQASGVMTCDWLAAAGFNFGGLALFEQTLERLVDACSQDGSP
ncbi:MAG: UDP-glucose 4-epimerase [Pseudomonadota bacterium]|jgi:nucleoside-diphosphate-sugar epimerase